MTLLANLIDRKKVRSLLRTQRQNALTFAPPMTSGPLIEIFGRGLLALEFNRFRCGGLFYIAIFATNVVVFHGSLWLVRSQETVQDGVWMKAMIPHHSIAF